MDKDLFSLNIAAQTARHKRVFTSSLIWPHRILRKLYLRWIKGGRIRSVFSHHQVTVRDPGRRFLKHAAIFSISLLMVSVFTPIGLSEIGFTADTFVEDSDFVGEDIPLEETPLLIDEEGFILKTSPVSEDSSRIGYTDKVTHKVVSGENLNAVAALYGLHVRTLMWENNMSDEDILRIGQTLVIPSVDGVTHVVASSETLASISKKYGVDTSLVKEHNNLAGDVIGKGQKLFIPGGKRADPIPVITRTAGRSGGGSTSARGSTKSFDSKNYIASSATPDDGKTFIFPTSGTITQGFSKGHYGVDIANPSKPDVWAVASGTVVTAKGGCVPREVEVDRSCGGGYGNYVVVDHGDGLQTLYAHLETVYVSEGQSVDIGQALGMMGNTGRTYGKTGRHAHVEFIKDGVKKNPAKFW